MNTKEFNYIRSFKKVLKRQVPFNIIEESDSSVLLETAPLCIGWFGTFFDVFVNSEGLFNIRFFPAGKIPKKNIPMFRDICSNTAGKISNIKLIINEDDFLTVSYETLLPDNEKIIETELKKAFGLLNCFYKVKLPPVMDAYWKTINKSESTEIVFDEDDDFNYEDDENNDFNDEDDDLSDE